MWSRIKNLFKRKPQQWELQIPFPIDKITLKTEVATYADVHLYRSDRVDVSEFSRDYLIINLEYSANSQVRLILTKEDIQALADALENKTEIGLRSPKRLPLKEAI